MAEWQLSNSNLVIDFVVYKAESQLTVPYTSTVHDVDEASNQCFTAYNTNSLSRQIIADRPQFTCTPLSQYLYCLSIP